MSILYDITAFVKRDLFPKQQTNIPKRNIGASCDLLLTHTSVHSPFRRGLSRQWVNW